MAMMNDQKTAGKISFYLTRDPWGFLSNFWRSPQIVDGCSYDSNERYYQCQKAKTPELRDYIYNAPSPYIAMVVGHNLRGGRELRDDWNDEMRIDVMLKGLRAKFNPVVSNEELCLKLLKTGDAYLFEDSPSDAFWGMVNGKGKNHLGRLLMQVRAELKIVFKAHIFIPIKEDGSMPASEARLVYKPLDPQVPLLDIKIKNLKT